MKQSWCSDLLKGGEGERKKSNRMIYEEWNLYNVDVCVPFQECVDDNTDFSSIPGG